MYSRPSVVGLVIRYSLIGLALLYALFPVLWILSASFNPTNNLLEQRLFPANPTLEHYRRLFTDPTVPFPRWILNTLQVSGITSLITVFLCALGAYAFSRFRFRGRRAGLLGLLLVQMFPQMLAMVAIYLLLIKIKEFIPWLGYNTHPGLIMVYLGGAMGFNTWFMKGYFDTIPRSVEESALVDGATPFQAFLRIVLPLARPILAVVLIIQFITTYSEYVLASILLKGTDMYTLSVGLRFFIQQAYDRRWGAFSAAAILGALLILAIFLPLQKLIISGLTGGAVKE
ncbi:MAG: Maltodextrin ABC transporter, permease protein MdxG [Candidatus Bipolaricaulis sibiricus]|uniref:Maltodextrin ABC transporter, permease protein MdxG n=1 Tax=Bipolaricaulis sibiricus TaxID=2501609 RepID=A0A410FSQ0_BIPS1|nr:MAG: Maltodextrin ABC transporter, permease protein MdxG [Candidatus Bipolaricaulis sibiricus]